MGPKRKTVHRIRQPDGTWKFEREIKTSMTAVTGRTAVTNKRVEQSDDKNVSHPMNVNKSTDNKNVDDSEVGDSASNNSDLNNSGSDSNDSDNDNSDSEKGKAKYDDMRKEVYHIDMNDLKSTVNDSDDDTLSKDGDISISGGGEFYTRRRS